MAKTKQTNASLDAVPTPSQHSVEPVEQDWIPGQEVDIYVVTRDGLRVSDNDYISPDWPGCLQERNFWQRVVNRYPDGTRVEIVKFIKRKHRTY